MTADMAQKKVIITLLFFNFLLFGGITSVIGASLPEIIRELQWTYSTVGLIIVANSGGYFISTFLSGLLSQRMGFKLLAGLGLILQAIGLAAFGVWTAISINLFSFIILGLGQGMIEVSTNHRVVQVEVPGQTRLMNLVHSAFTIGAILTPMVVGLVFKVHLHWRVPFIGLCILCLVMFIVFLFFDTSAPKTPATPSRFPWDAIKRMTSKRLVWLLTLIIMVYVGAEIGISSWISELFVSHFNASASLGALMVSIYWGGILVGRIFVALGWTGSNPTRTLLHFSAFSVFTLGLAMWVESSWLACILYFATGLGFSTIYPTTMSIIGKEFQEAQGPAIGIVSTGGGLGVCLFPLLMASLSTRFGVDKGFLFYLLLTIIMTLLAYYVYRSNQAAPELNTPPQQP